MNEAIQLFFEKFPQFKNQKYDIRPLDNGFTNKSFCISFADQSFQIRIGKNNDVVNRKNEFNVIKTLNIKEVIFFDVNNGNMIKTWIPGETPTQISDQFIAQLINKINDFHKIKPKIKIETHDYFNCFKKLKNQIEDKYLSLYKELVNSVVDYNDFVLSHNDLNYHNIVVTKENKLVFIDFEWSNLNDKYWDFANFIREFDLSFDELKRISNSFKELNYEKLIKFIYICICYSVQWTYCVKETSSIIWYRNKTYKMMLKFYDYIVEKKYVS